jgi:hypothetical protein
VNAFLPVILLWEEAMSVYKGISVGCGLLLLGMVVACAGPTPTGPPRISPRAQQVLDEFIHSKDSTTSLVGQWRHDDIEHIEVMRIYRKDGGYLMQDWFVIKDSGEASGKEHKLYLFSNKGEHRYVWDRYRDIYLQGQNDAEFYSIHDDGFLVVCGIDTGVFERYRRS